MGFKHLENYSKQASNLTFVSLSFFYLQTGLFVILIKYKILKVTNENIIVLIVLIDMEMKLWQNGDYNSLSPIYVTLATQVASNMDKHCVSSSSSTIVNHIFFQPSHPSLILLWILTYNFQNHFDSKMKQQTIL